MQRVAEVVAYRCLQDLVDEVLHRTDAGDDPRGHDVGDVDLHLQIDRELESFLTLGRDGGKAFVQIVSLAVGLAPVQREDEGRDHHHLVDVGVQRVLARAQRLLPETAVSRAHQ